MESRAHTPVPDHRTPAELIGSLERTVKRLTEAEMTLKELGRYERALEKGHRSNLLRLSHYPERDLLEGEAA